MSLAECLRVLVVTDHALAAPRSVTDVVRAALEGGARSIQVRGKTFSSSELYELTVELRPLVHDVGGLLFVNDRFDIALAAGADGVHLGPDDLPVAEVRRWVPDDFLIGYSCDDPEVARRAEAEGADYLGCGTVFATSTKSDAGEAIGVERLDQVARAVSIPVVGIGGITLENVGEVLSTRAVGVAVVGAVMGAGDVERVVRGLSTDDMD